MNTENLFTFITAQDEYHCLLEKMMLRAVNLYSGVENTIENVLTENYVQMEKACLKEEYGSSSFFYMKQLEEIVLFGLNAVGNQKILDDLREVENAQWKLSALGEKMVNFRSNTNKDQIEKLKKGEIIQIKHYQWRVKLNLFKHYFDTKVPDFDVDELIYYKRNQYSHADPVIDLAKELRFEQKFPSCYYFMNKVQINLRKYSDALALSQNR